jgi:zinc transport system ATP-binding protein
MAEDRRDQDAGPVVEVGDLSFSYDGVTVLKDVRFILQPRDFVGVVGPNGGGKTTLLKLLLGLLKPSRGTVRVYGQPPGRVRHRIGYVPQHFLYDANFPVLVRDVVLMGRLGRGLGLGPFRRSDKEAASTALGEVGLSELERRPFANLSGGQRQRVLIARALVSEPGLLLLDEPTANIDLAVEKALSGLLRELNERMTILMVTHDVTFVAEAVEKVICVNRTVAQHPTDAVCGDLMRELYGGEIRMVRHDHSVRGRGPSA